MNFGKPRRCCIIVAIYLFPGENRPFMKLYPVCYRIKVRIHWKNTVAIKIECLCIRILHIYFPKLHYFVY